MLRRQTTSKVLAKAVVFYGLAFLAQAASTRAYGQWEIQTGGVTSDLKDVCFVDSLYGWAVGNSGTIVATSDGGKSWTRQFEATDAIDLEKVIFVSRREGFAGGNRNVPLPTRVESRAVLLRTVDGGMHWEASDLSFGLGLSFSDMDFWSSKKGWVAVNNGGGDSYSQREGILLRTENSGKDWTVMIRRKPDLIGAVRFYDDEHGYLFWSPFFDNFDDTDVYRTEDGARTWSWVGKIREDLIRKAEFLSRDTLWSLGYKVWRSEDQGRSWTGWNWFNPVYAHQRRFKPTDIHVFDAENVWIIGGSYSDPADVSALLITTHDSGRNWRVELEMAQNSFSGLSVVGKQHAWIVGGRGLVLHRRFAITGITHRGEILRRSFTLEQNYPNPFCPYGGYDKTTIRFLVTSQQHITITVYDILGREIKVLLSEVTAPGNYSLTWDGRDASNGLEVPPGVYFYELRSPTLTLRRKMLVIP